MNRGVLLVVSGPAGVGKGTVCKQFLKDNENVKLSVSATTRAPMLADFAEVRRRKTKGQRGFWG